MSSPFVPIDPADYTRAPAMNVATGVSLAQALAEACPGDAEPAVKKARARLAEVANNALNDVTSRNKQLGQSSEEDSRVLDNKADRAWGGLRLRLQAMAMIREQTDKAERAKVVEWKLFHGSTEFLKLDYGSQSTRMAAVLKQIDDDNLQPALDALCGPEFLAACRAVQPEYAAMVSERLRRDKASGTDLNETLRALGAAIVNYATKVVATAEPEEPATHDRVRTMLRPIAAHRESWATLGGAPAAEQPAPTPPVVP